MITKNNLNKFLKKSLICTLSITSLISLNSCNKGPSKDYIDNAIAIVYQDEKPYLINTNKETYALDYYEEIEQSFNDYIAVKYEGKYGFIDKTGKQTVPTIYDKVYPMSEEKAVVIKDGVYQIIDCNGNTLYTFTDSVISESYFKEDHLIVNKNDLYGYLSYNKKDKSFTLSEIKYDQVKPFHEGFAVVGKKATEIIYKEDEEGNLTEEIEEIRVYENIKYNYVNTDFELLFDDFTFDYADSFYNNYAVVGYYDTITSPYYDDNKTISTDGLMYKYITTVGTTYKFNYRYVHEYWVYHGYNDKRLEKENIHLTDELYYPYVTSFKTDLAFVAKYRYNSHVNNYVKEYMLVDLNGSMPYAEAIRMATTFRFGHDDNKDYQAQTPGMFIIDNLVKYKDTYIFKAGQTLTAPSWQTYYINYNVIESKYEFATASWNLFKQKDENGKDIEVLPDWAKSYNEEYLNNASSSLLLKYSIEHPYEMLDYKIINNSNDELLINAIRISRSNNYGLVKYETSTVEYDGYYGESTVLTASFILEPIYDKIIY